MTRKTIAICGDELLNRIDSDTDSPWRDVVGWNCDELDALESLSDPSEEQSRRRDALDTECKAQAAAAWWEVSWPEHVICPAYNGDANYARHHSEAAARESADSVYGE